MKLIRKYAAVLAVILVTACQTATTENYNSILDSWIGQGKKDLVLSWGIPDREYRLDPSTELVSYKSRRQIYYPGNYSLCTAYDRSFGTCAGGFPPYLQYLSCETTFTVVSGKISQWRHEGNDCRI